MKHDFRPQAPAHSLKKTVVTKVFWLCIVWDLFTTFLGSLIILGSSHIIALGLGLVGTFIVGVFNFLTKPIWQVRQHQPPEIRLLQLIWTVAIAYDFWTSLTCNTTSIALKRLIVDDSGSLFQLLARLSVGQVLVVLFVTTLTTISPMLFGYLRENDLDILN